MPEQKKQRIQGLLRYVEEIARLTESFITSVRSYPLLGYFEHELRNRVGITHDFNDENGAIWLKIDRLPRTEPPAPSEDITSWIKMSSDPKQEPEIIDQLVETMERPAALKLVKEGTVEEDDLLPSPQAEDGELIDVRLRIERLPKVVSAVEQFLDAWRVWAAEERPRRETMAIYNRFFSVLQDVEAGGADNSLEVVMGLGVIAWRTSDTQLQHPLIEFLVELEIDTRTHAIYVRPRQTPPTLFLKPFIKMEHPAVGFLRDTAAKVFELGNSDEDVETTIEWAPFHVDRLEPILLAAVSKLSDAASYRPETSEDPTDRTVPAAGPDPVITDTWAIYARPRSSSFIIQDVERLADLIEDVSADDLPAAAEALVTPLSDESTFHDGIDLQAGVSSHEGYEVSSPTMSKDVDAYDLFLPKPFNEAQLKILRRLEKSVGMVVQGPPGTGKTHTIANIISHYLATGRSVLVTSNGEPALDVLRDQIPEGVRELVVSLLTRDREGQAQLERAVTLINNEVMSLDPHSIEAERVELERKIVELRGQSEAIEREVEELATKQLEAIPWQDEQLSARNLALLVADNRSRFDWLRDSLSMRTEHEPQFSDDDIREVRKARLSLGADLKYLDTELPSPSDLPTASEITAIHENLNRARELESQLQSEQARTVSIRTPDSRRAAEGLLANLEKIAKFLRDVSEDEWLRSIFLEWLIEGTDSEKTSLLNALLGDMKLLADERPRFQKLPVELPDSFLSDERLKRSIERAAEGARYLPFNPLTRRGLERLLKQITIEGRTPTSREDWQHVKAFIEFREKLIRFASRWNAASDEYGLPSIDPGNPQSSRMVRDWYSVIATARAVAVAAPDVIREMRKLFPGVHDPGSVLIQTDYLEKIIDVLRIDLHKLQLLDSREKLVRAKQTLAGYSGEIVEELERYLNEEIGFSDKVSDAVGAGWRELIGELQRVRDLRPKLDTVVRVAGLVEQSGAPHWAEELKNVETDGTTDPFTPEHWYEGWQLQRAEAHLKDTDVQERIQELSRRRRLIDNQLERAMAELVKLRTYLGLHQRMTQSRLSALRRFVTAVREMGTGRGKRATRLRGDAREALRKCIDAVPCWIMPTWRISETLPSNLEAFDLVIVDEASQSDVMALPAILRAKQVLIVGDDRQVSPSTIGIEERKLLQIRHSFLKGQPFAAELMPGKSLYDLGNAIFPGDTVMLNEHFRCVEPIIRFSFQFYDEKITPVRIPKPSERLVPPLIDVYVKNGKRDGRRRTNEAEAIAVVDEIERIMNDPYFEGRTIGVISLIGAQQAALIQRLLLDRVGEKRFLDHEVICGDAATFQGREKDIMFISMVASPGQAVAQTARQFAQRFNVALSRARDRMYLFRSVQLDDLSNPADLKRKVLEHFEHPMDVGHAVPENALELCESGFERDVFSRLSKLGYDVTPQVAVAGHRIDLVVEGDNDRRLAIELDGDSYHGPEKWLDDWTRQRRLERVGWTFWRCWASTYYLDREATISELVRVLEEMGIGPRQTATSSGRHPLVEYREVGGGAESVEELGVIARDETMKSAESSNNTVESTNGSTIHNDKEQLGLWADTSPDDADISPAMESSSKSAVGDVVIVEFDDDPGRHYTLTLSSADHDLLNGVISLQEPIGEALALAEIDDEIDVTWNGRKRRALVLERK